MESKNNNSNQDMHHRISPVDNSITWTGDWATPTEIESAMDRANGAFFDWSRTTLEERTAIARAFASFLGNNRVDIAKTITLESGKPLWESDLEVTTSILKVDNAIDAIRSRRWTTGDVTNNPASVIRYRPLGPMIVLGPYNLPLHLPGAHIVPALLAGNTILFKPSEKTPAVGDWIARAWRWAQLPADVLECIHGAVEQAKRAVSMPQTAGVLFTGSYHAGVQIHKQLAGRPECLLALEMGGNNPLVVDRIHNQKAAIASIIQSAYITSGQRCTCARRLFVVNHPENRGFLDDLSRSIAQISVANPLIHPQPFMGTLVSNQAAQSILDAQSDLKSHGAVVLNEARIVGDNHAMLSPGLLQSKVVSTSDEEVFGPLAIAHVVNDLDEAIELANRSKYGLAAGLLSDDRAAFEHFASNVRAGIINWNAPTTGASGKLPFGGIGASGNHRPSGSFAADYCSYPVASIENQELVMSSNLPPGLERI
jgi:succinylglutamic semialdehyde dehydrogenase